MGRYLFVMGPVPYFDMNTWDAGELEQVCCCGLAVRSGSGSGSVLFYFYFFVAFRVKLCPCYRLLHIGIRYQYGNYVTAQHALRSTDILGAGEVLAEQDKCMYDKHATSYYGCTWA